MSPRDAKEHKFWVEHYGKLIGKVVKAVCHDPEASKDLGQQLYGLEFTDGTVAFVLCDPEGNGPGFLQIDEKTIEPFKKNDGATTVHLSYINGQLTVRHGDTQQILIARESSGDEWTKRIWPVLMMKG